VQYTISLLLLRTLAEMPSLPQNYAQHPAWHTQSLHSCYFVKQPLKQAITFRTLHMKICNELNDY